MAKVEAENNEIRDLWRCLMINLNDYEETFTQLGISKNEANEVVSFFEVLAQIAIERIKYKLRE